MPRVTDRFIQEGDVLTLSAPYAVTPGDGLLVGSLFGIASAAAALNAAVEVQTEGVWDVAKTAGQTFAQGALVYWDNAAKSVTSVSAGNYRIGVATQAAAGGDATARVRLNGVGVPTGA